MNTELLVRLLDAGFTKNEIMKLAEPAKPEPAPNPEPAAPEAPEADQAAADPEPAAPAAPEAKQAASDPETGKRLDAIENSIASLVKAVQLNNLRNDSFGTAPESLETQTDKIMAAIIRPESDRKEDA